MSHEIRTPLSGVIGLTGLLLESSLQREQREQLELILGSSEALLSIVNDILDFSKVEAGTLSLDPEPVALRGLAEGALSLLALRAQEKGIELCATVDPAVPEFVIADAGRVRQVLLNLLGNAVKFTEQGAVSLAIRRLETATEPDHVRLCFEITDTGIGIAADQLEAVFEPFQQADLSITRRFGGTGLGLSITRRLVTLMGGTTRICSVLGRGTTVLFDVSLPCPTGPTGAPFRFAPARWHGETALLIEPHPVVRQALSALVDESGLASSAVDGTQAALGRLADSATPAPVVVIVRDRLDGLDRVLSAARARSLPVVLLVGADGQLERTRALPAGEVVPLVALPARRADLGKALATVAGLEDEATGPLVASGAAPGAQRVAPAERVALQVLLVEDHPVNRRLATVLLERQGHDVTTAENGQQAVELVRSRRFDLVLMDVQMPVMDGLTATREIRRTELLSGHYTPIVAMTANAMKGDRELCLAAGMDDYVTKPVRVEELIAAIDRAAALPT